MRQGTATSWGARRGARFDGVSPVGLAAVIAALHLAVLARRVPMRSLHHRQMTLLTWRMPTAGSADSPRAAEPPSRPVQTFCAGQLALTLGMAVLALTLWLQIMRINGAHGS